jgi:F5/8 type C domain
MLLPRCAAVIGIPVYASISTALPPRSNWHASSSSIETPAMAAAFAIDGDDKTHWGGSFSPGNWLQIDLGAPASIAGAVIHWDSGFAVAYSIQSSVDGTAWHTAFETSDAHGATEYVFFPAVTARHVRLASPARTSD